MNNRETSRASQYLSRILQANPLDDPQSLLAVRRKALGLKQAVANQQLTQRSPTSDKKRQAIHAHVKQLQSDFWTLPIESLRQQLTAIDLKEFPELRPTLARLRTIAACRPEFAKLTQEKYTEMALFRAFKTAVVLPANEAGPVRERFIRRITEKSQLKSIQIMIRGMKKNHEILYQLERDWFESIMKLKAPRAQASQTQDEEYYFESDNEGGGWGWAAIVGVVIIVRVLLTLMSHS